MFPAHNSREEQSVAALIVLRIHKAPEASSQQQPTADFVGGGSLSATRLGEFLKKRSAAAESRLRGGGRGGEARRKDRASSNPSYVPLLQKEQNNNPKPTQEVDRLKK